MSALQPFQERVAQEKAELDEKLGKLKAFRRSPSFKTLPVEERDRLSRQESAMDCYSGVLGERIEAFA